MRWSGIQGLTPRAIIIGLLGACAACFVVAWAELIVQTIQIAICQFAPAAIGLLLLVVILNRVGRLVSRRLALQPHEIIVIYVMILVAALTTSRGLLEKLIPALIAANYYTTEANHWRELYYRSFPKWAVAFDPMGGAEQPVARYFYEGLPRGVSLPWGAWATPLLFWGLASLAVIFCFLCIASIMRKQWVDHEKLTFPLVNLPLEMAGATQMGLRPFFANRLMWVGFALPTVIFMMNGLHGLYPSVPQVPVEQPLNARVFDGLGKPWRDLGYTTAYFSLAAIGFAYFLPQQLLFSLWAFYVFVRLQNIVFSAFQATPEAMPLYPTSLPNGYQVAGAYLVLTGHLVRSALPHLRQVWAKATGRPSPLDDSAEALSSRTAVFGLLVGAGVVVVFCRQLGMVWYMALVQVLVYLFVVSVVMARSVSEAGMLMTETSFRPVNLLQLFMPRQLLGRQTLAALALTDAVYTRDLRGCLLSTFLDVLKLSDGARIRRRHLVVAIGLGLLVCFVVGGYLHITFPYREGAVGMYSYVYHANCIWGIQDYAPVLDVGERYNPRLPIYFSSGVLITVALAVMRQRYWWWPLYPLGFALSGSWSMIVFWCPIFLAWVLKTAILRYGGMKTYSVLRPLFLGLILGEFSQAVLWATIAGIWRTPAPFFPWP